MNSFPLEKVTMVNEIPTFWVVADNCVKCKGPFALGELALACGPPHFSLLHMNCAPTHLFYGYPHDKPMIQHYQISKQREIQGNRPPLLKPE